MSSQRQPVLGLPATAAPPPPRETPRRTRRRVVGIAFLLLAAFGAAFAGLSASIVEEVPASTTLDDPAVTQEQSETPFHGECKPLYSFVECIEGGQPSAEAARGAPSLPQGAGVFSDAAESGRLFVGASRQYEFPVYNRSCLYRNLVYNPATKTFVFHTADATGRVPVRVRRLDDGLHAPYDVVINATELPRVSLASRPFDIHINIGKRRPFRRKMEWAMHWRPLVAVGSVPCKLPRRRELLAYYAPIVAPWNFAHTLLCDLFGLFWAMREFGIVTLSAQVVAVGKHYGASFPFPKTKNAAFGVFSRLPPTYDHNLRAAVYDSVVAGIGTKTWSWVTAEYKASGSVEYWWAFRAHIMAVTGAGERKAEEETAGKEGNVEGTTTRERSTRRPIRVSVCHKKDKRGVVNYDEVLAWLVARFGPASSSDEASGAEFVLETPVGRTPREQVQMMLDADVYMCNEGTLGTPFFLMAPGSVFVSLPLVYHTPHLHRTNMPAPSLWWKEPDTLRPDPRKNTGGNIDWFPPAIPWVKTVWYNYVPLNETKIQLPLTQLRNYMPEFNVIVKSERLGVLLKGALMWVRSHKPTGGARAAAVVAASSGSLAELAALMKEPSPNYSINAQMCRELLQKTPAMTVHFNSARCLFGMSWLCEFWTNTRFRWRLLHERWRLSNGRCGGRESNPSAMGVSDPRDARPMRDFLFYSREELADAYRHNDLANFTATSEELDAVFQRS